VDQSCRYLRTLRFERRFFNTEEDCGHCIAEVVVSLDGGGSGVSEGQSSNLGVDDKGGEFEMRCAKLPTEGISAGQHGPNDARESWGPGARSSPRLN